MESPILQALIFTFNNTKEFVLIEICCGPFLKVILLGLVLLHFRVVFKASSFSKFPVTLSSEFHTTFPLYEKLFLPSSVFFRFTSSNTPLRLDSIASPRLYRYPRSCLLIQLNTSLSKSNRET